MSRSIRWLWAMACVVLVIVTACSSGGGKATGGNQETTPPTAPPATAEWTSVTTAPPAPAPARQITIEGFGYTQATVPPGAQVTVVNKDSANHTVTSDAVGKFDTQVAGNGQVTFTAPYEPGSYPYHCTYHTSMHGTLVVQ